jgi:3-oxoacyl-[acyl-carrier protein] reductase
MLICKQKPVCYIIFLSLPIHFLIDPIMNDTGRFNKRHILITGGARGIGFEIAIQFAREGAVISLLDFNKETLSAAVEELKKTNAVYGYEVDVADRAAVDNVVTLAEKIQPIDVLVNNAGIAIETPFLQIEEKEWKRIIDINLTGMFYVAQSVCREMVKRKNGVVINMASKNGMDGEFGYAHYNASKAGVIMLTKTMALELAHAGIRVNAVCPGYIQTPMSMEIDSPAVTAAFADRFIPMNRPGNTKEIATIFLFLASDDSSFITGQVIVADGGQLAGQKPGKDQLNRYPL